MSAAPITQLFSVSRPRDGQARFGQRCITSPSGLTISVPQSGQCVGIWNGFVPRRCLPAGPTTCGITSPARWTITSSPSRMSLRLMSSSLCSVAREIVTPPTSTGSSTAHGIEVARAADADADLVQPRRRGHRRPLERARPARPLVQRAEPLLLVVRVDLDHDAVDLVVELGAPELPLAHELGDLGDRLEPLRERVRREAALAQPLQRLPVRREVEALAEARAVHPDRERTRRRDRRVLLPERAGGGVPRVRPRRLSPRRRAPRWRRGIPRAACRPRRAPRGSAVRRFPAFAGESS